MNRKLPLFGLPALAVALTLPTIAPAARAQAQAPPPSQQQEPEQQKIQSYVGQVVKAKNGQFALLINKGAGTGFYLDNQEKAKAFEGQNVKVTGILDAANGIIKVSDIVPA